MSWRKVRHMSRTSSSESNISSSSTEMRRERAVSAESEMRSGSSRESADSRRASEETPPPEVGLVRSRSVLDTSTDSVFSVSSKTAYTCSSMHSSARTSNGASSAVEDCASWSCSSRRWISAPRAPTAGRSAPMRISRSCCKIPRSSPKSKSMYPCRGARNGADERSSRTSRDVSLLWPYMERMEVSVDW